MSFHDMLDIEFDQREAELSGHDMARLARLAATGYQIVSPDTHPDWFGGFAANANGTINDDLRARGVDCEDEIYAAYARAKEPRGLRCAYCLQSFPRTKDRRKAIAWFHTHPCNSEYLDNQWADEPLAA